jgi:hypothetical protein
MLAKFLPRRSPDDEVFGRVLPHEETLQYIQEREQNGWFLVTTRSGRDQSVRSLHRVLSGHGNVQHYQLSGILDGAVVPLNLYFLWDNANNPPHL